MDLQKTVRTLLATGALAGASLAITATPAGAAHCDDAGGPGNSDFSSHVRATNGPGAHDEGDHYGWSSCEDTPNQGETNPKNDR